MTGYTELIRSLKACEHDECYPERCDWFGKYQVDLRCKNILLANAAAAIEALEAALAEQTEISEIRLRSWQEQQWENIRWQQLYDNAVIELQAAQPHWVRCEDAVPEPHKNALFCGSKGGMFV